MQGEPEPAAGGRRAPCKPGLGRARRCAVLQTGQLHLWDPTAFLQVFVGPDLSELGTEGRESSSGSLRPWFGIAFSAPRRFWHRAVGFTRLLGAGRCLCSVRVLRSVHTNRGRKIHPSGSLPCSFVQEYVFVLGLPALASVTSQGTQRLWMLAGGVWLRRSDFMVLNPESSLHRPVCGSKLVSLPRGTCSLDSAFHSAPLPAVFNSGSSLWAASGGWH